MHIGGAHHGDHGYLIQSTIFTNATPGEAVCAKYMHFFLAWFLLVFCVCRYTQIKGVHMNLGLQVSAAVLSSVLTNLAARDG